MPNEFQNITLHEKLRNIVAFQKVKTTLTKRGIKESLDYFKWRYPERIQR